ISSNYTLDEDTYPQFLLDNDEEMDLLSFIRTADPTKVRVGERQRAEGEPKLLDTTLGRVVPLLLVAPAHASSELEVSVDKLFDEGGSGGQTEQGDSASGGHGVDILPVSDTVEIVAKDAAPVQPKRQRIRKNHYSSHHLGANIAEAEVDSFVRPSILLMTVATSVTSTVDTTTTVKEKFVESFIFSGDSSSGGADHTVGGFSDLTGSDFIVGGICTIISLDVDLQKVYVPQWCVTNGSRLDDGRTCREMVDEFAPPKFFALIRGMDHVTPLKSGRSGK
ncbi:hypothetical protein Tco_1544600, partial [Tanacetum coccineum]